MSLQPPSEGLYRTLDDLLTHANMHARTQGYAITKQRTKKNVRTGEVNKANLRCDKGGAPRSRKVADATRRREKVSRLTDCPFSILAILRKEGWYLEVKCAEHNHEPSETAAAHPRHRKMTPLVRAQIAELSSKGMPPKQIMETLKKCNDGLPLVATDVYNYRKSIKKDGTFPEQTPASEGEHTPAPPIGMRDIVGRDLVGGAAESGRKPVEYGLIMRRVDYTQQRYLLLRKVLQTEMIRTLGRLCTSLAEECVQSKTKNSRMPFDMCPTCQKKLLAHADYINVTKALREHCQPFQGFQRHSLGFTSMRGSMDWERSSVLDELAILLPLQDDEDGKMGVIAIREGSQNMNDDLYQKEIRLFHVKCGDVMFLDRRLVKMYLSAGEGPLAFFSIYMPPSSILAEVLP